MKRLAIAAAVVALAASLTGCTPAPAPPPSSSATKTPIPTPTASPKPTKPVDISSTADIGAMAYDMGVYITSVPSGDAAPGAAGDAFPVHSRVQMVRISLEGSVPFGKADVSGLSVTNSAWEGQLDLAVQDEHESPAHAARLGLPWNASGAFGDGTTWSLDAGKPVNFLLGFYVPAGATVLNVLIDIPSQAAALKLRVPLAVD
jgi:hypothetical protein